MNEQEVAGYKIPEDLANAVLNYLAERPWREVVQLMDRLKMLEPIMPAPNKTAKK